MLVIAEDDSLADLRIGHADAAWDARAFHDDLLTGVLSGKFFVAQREKFGELRGLKGFDLKVHDRRILIATPFH